MFEWNPKGPPLSFTKEDKVIVNDSEWFTEKQMKLINDFNAKPQHERVFAIDDFIEKIHEREE